MKKAIFLVLILVMSSLVFAEQGQGGPIQYGECGDQICDNGENTSSYPYYCPEDCQDFDTDDVTCGDGKCEGDELKVWSQKGCPQDCAVDPKPIAPKYQNNLARDVILLKQEIQQKQQLMEQEKANLSNLSKKVYQNQNQVRLAVHALLGMENMTGGIGKNISAIARTYNNSVMATIRAEEKIQTRSGFTRFFAGGDETTAEELEAEVEQNQLRIQQLTQLRNECQCDQEVKDLMQEQIQTMQQEQTRLRELAQQEKKSKGLFDWS